MLHSDATALFISNKSAVLGGVNWSLSSLADECGAAWCLHRANGSAIL